MDGAAVQTIGRTRVKASTLLALSGFMLAMGVFYHLFPFIGDDWELAYRPAAIALMSGRSPYTGSFFNAPWVLLPLIPLAVLPVRLSNAILMTFNLAAFIFLAFKCEARPISFFAYMVSFPVIYAIGFGQIDALLMAGAFLPPAAGLFLVLAKPQIGIVLALFWFVQAWQAGGWKRAARVFAPVGAAFLCSFLVFGFWPLTALNSNDFIHTADNFSLFPWSILPGILIMVLSLKRNSKISAISASALFSPYLSMATWSIPVLVLLRSRWLFPLLVLASWIWIAQRAL